jgi:tetratricopeptide (TPR) repeat protein
MPRWFLLSLFLPLSLTVLAWSQQQGAQSSQPSPGSAGTSSSAQGSSSTGISDPKPAKSRKPDLSPPRSDRVDAGDLGRDIGESSSKDTQIDLSPPADDARKHPESSDILLDAGSTGSSGSGVGEFHSWDPHKAAKSVEVGDFYFKRKNYRAAEDRYREALKYKDNDAIATFRLAVCLEKLERPGDARAEYESYLRILPHGPQAEEAQKAIDRLKAAATSAKQSK